MDFFDDGTYYSFQHYENSINIGWMLPNKLYNNIVNEELVEKLVEYIPYSVNTIRGGNGYKKIVFKNKELLLGFSEFRIIAADGTVYACPDLIIYSILYKNYNPPREFINAVFNGLSCKTDEYASFVENYNEDCFWGASKDYACTSRKILNYIKNSDIESINYEFKRNVGLINIVTEQGSLLNAALKYNNKQLAMNLINMGIDINKFNGVELLSAIEMEQNEIANILLNNNISIRKYSPKVNPLFYAVAKGNNYIAEKLLRSRKDLLIVYSNEFIRECDILKWSIRCKNDEFLSIMEKNGVCINCY